MGKFKSWEEIEKKIEDTFNDEDLAQVEFEKQII